MNILVTKCACQATSVTKRTLSRLSGLAPQKVSTTNRRLPESCSVTSFCADAPRSLVSIGLLSLSPWSDHQIVSRVVSSRTMYLSRGERPVKSPVSTEIAPDSVSLPTSKPL